MKIIIFCALALLASVRSLESSCGAGLFLNIDGTCGNTCSPKTLQVQIPVNAEVSRLLVDTITTTAPVASSGPNNAGPYFTVCYCVPGYQASGDVCTNTTNIATASNNAPITIIINDNNTQQQVASASSNSISSAKSKSGSKSKSRSKSKAKPKSKHHHYYYRRPVVHHYKKK